MPKDSSCAHKGLNDQLAPQYHYSLNLSVARGPIIESDELELPETQGIEILSKTRL